MTSQAPLPFTLTPEFLSQFTQVAQMLLPSNNQQLAITANNPYTTEVSQIQYHHL